jgi:Tfp pilus assembly protein PilN
MRAVNLLPSDSQRVRKPVNRVALAGVAGGAAVSMLLGALYLNAQASVSDREAELVAAKAELAATPKPKIKPSANEELAKERAGRVVALSAALGSRVGWDRLLGQLSSVLPDDVWLTTLDAKAPSPATTAAAAGGPAAAAFRIQGYTYTQEGVARFLARLEVLPDLTEVGLESSIRADVAGQRIYQFAIKAQVRPTGATS